MTITIGLVLACVTLFLAVTAVINGNTRTTAMMRVSGYSQRDCCSALLGGYRPLAVFALLYEIVMCFYPDRIKRIFVKQAMLE